MFRGLFLSVLTLQAVVLSSCAPEQPDEIPVEIASQRQGLTGAARRPRAEAIRDVAATKGLMNAVLLAGIAEVETGLSHCWSEAKWACQGPRSDFCGGPVIAGSADGPCTAQQGGLGMFQFDAGTYDQTLARDGQGILLLEGNIVRAVDFVTEIVRKNIPGVSTAAQALEWMNGMTVAQGDARLEQWAALLACRYNGACGSTSQAAKYRDATLRVLSEFGADFWRAGARFGKCLRRNGPFAWSCAGAIAGMTCTQVQEASDPDTWGDNYFCAGSNLGMRWASNGPIAGMRCTRIHEPSDPHTWDDNYLCLPNDSRYRFSWLNAGGAGANCIAWSEPSDPHTWGDNYLCFSN